MLLIFKDHGPTTTVAVLLAGSTAWVAYTYNKAHTTKTYTPYIPNRPQQMYGSSYPSTYATPRYQQPQPFQYTPQSAYAPQAALQQLQAGYT